MGHRKWIKARYWREFHADDMIAEHNALYDEWKASERRVMETLDENNRLDRDLDEARQAQDNLIFQRNDFRHWHMNEQKKVADLTAELDEARKRIAELEVSTRVPFSDAQIERMAEAACDGWGDNAQGIWFTSSDNAKSCWRDCIRAALAAGGLEPCAVPEYDPDDVALRQSGHVLRDRLVDARRKVENQRVELKRLHALVTDLRDQLAAADLDLADKAFYIREFASVSAERDALRECDSVPDVDPPADQVEALARVLHKSQDAFYCRYGDHATKFDDHTPLWSTMARAAIAHLAKRPEGLPTAEEIKAAHLKYVEGYRKGENDGSMCATDFALDYLRPWLRDPVGFELDAHPDQLELYKWVTEPDGGYAYAAQQAIDLCRSRIKPVYECKECAKWEARYKEMKRWHDRLDGMIEAARAALEGE